MTERELILATSAQRDEYMRDFLTCLASPEGHRVAFSYRRSWFAKDLVVSKLPGREALIVFCDAEDPAAEFTAFLAVRRVQIEQLIPTSIERLRGATAVTVVFRLGSLIGVTDDQLPELLQKWRSSLGAIDHRPRPIEHPDTEKARFVFEHPRLAEAEGNPDPKEGWRALSEELGRCKTLKNAFFFRVGELRRAGGAATDVLKTKRIGSLHRVYRLRPSSEYELPMDAYSKSGKIPYSEAIDVTSSSDQLAVQAVTQSSAGRASEAIIVIRAGEVKRPHTSTLVIHGAKDVVHRVPRVEIATCTEPQRWLAGALIIVIAIGVVLGGLPEDAFGLSDGVVYPLKVAGGLLAGGATLVAVGRVSGIGA